MAKQKALFGRWGDMRIGAINKLLKPFGCRLVLKKSKEWGDQVSLTAHPADGVIGVIRGNDVPVPPSDPGARHSAGQSGAIICEHSWSAGEPKNCVHCGVSREAALS